MQKTEVIQTSSHTVAWHPFVDGLYSWNSTVDGNQKSGDRLTS